MKKVISASVTPLNMDGSLDKVGLKNIFERNLKHGIHGFFILGSMGEWGSFSEDFKTEMVAESSKIIGKRAELLVGINATSLSLELEHLKMYSGYDFDSYVVMLPGRTSALEPVRSILKVLDTADRPVYYYHCPPNNGIELSLADFAEIMRHPNLKGIKNSASNMVLRRELLLLRKDAGFPVLLFEGQEWALDEALIAGNDGMVCGMGSLASNLMVKLAAAVDELQYDAAVRFQEMLIKVYNGVYGKNLDAVWVGQKYALHYLGLLSSPFSRAQEMDILTPERKREIEKTVETFRNELA